MIGSLGDTTFEVSSEAVRTFRDARRRKPSRWAVHEVIGQAPVTEYLGPGLAAVSLTIQLRLSLGIDPEEELTRIQDAQAGAEVLQLILGDDVIGSYVLRDLDETWAEVQGDGTRPAIDLALSLEEYGSG